MLFWLQAIILTVLLGFFTAITAASYEMICLAVQTYRRRRQEGHWM